MRAYRAAAARSGLSPLDADIIATERSRQVMGLFRRAELVAAIRGTLETIRVALPRGAPRARFDHLFRPRGEWIVDLHDAALAWARHRAPGLTWDAARRSLVATRWLPPGDTVASAEAVPGALYGLTVLGATDAAAFEAELADLRSADSASSAAVMLLLTGYTEGRKWYLATLRFFLSQPWIPDQHGGRSLADHVGSFWRRNRPGRDESWSRIPEIQGRLFGHPQAVPHYGVPPALFQRLVKAENPAARVWLERHGQAALLRALRRLPAGDTSLVLLQAGPEAMRLTTVPRQSRESLNGFLEPHDAIAIDPGYSPLLALGAVVHEWQHLLFRRQQLETYAARLALGGEPIIELPWIDPYLAEGFAEWSTEQILTAVAERWPLLSLGELLKRAALARAGVVNQHAMGYALVAALGDVLGDQAATTDLLLRHAGEPSRILSHPALRRSWAKHRTGPDRVLAVPAPRVLIPEITFTVEDGFPDVLGSRILVPPNQRSKP